MTLNREGSGPQGETHDETRGEAQGERRGRPGDAAGAAPMGTTGDGWLRPRRREGPPELLEAPDARFDLVKRSLADLDRLNRHPGGHDMTLRGVSGLLGARGRRAGGPPKGSEASVLDLACGGASLARRTCRWAADRGIRVEVTATDFRPGILEAARSSTPEDLPVRFALADARALPFQDRSFDVATLSLALHHFPPAVAVGVLSEMLRVSRLGIVVNDLVRSWVCAAGSRTVIRLLSDNPYTRQDGVASAGRAYTRPEMRRLALAAGARGVRFSGVPGYRAVMVASRA